MTRTAAAVALLAVAGGLRAQTPAPPDAARLLGQSDQTYKRLLEAQRILADGKPAEAADVLQRVMDEAGDDLVQADAGRTHFRPARRVAQQVLVRLPADARRAYRDRADEPARKLLAAGKTARDPRSLLALLDRYFLSGPAEEALLLLGELAFERGEFRAAEEYWRRLLPQTDPAAEPSCPDPKIDPAAVRARVVLALIFQGDRARAKAELGALKAAAPKASGRLAGRDGSYVETLQALLDRPPELGNDTGDGEWTGLGGSSARSGRAGRLPYYWPTRPTWVAPISPDSGRSRVYSLPRAGSTASVGFHPVVLDGVAYVADAVRVFGFDLKTGKPRFAYDFRNEPNRPMTVNLGLPLGYDADFTLTAAGGRLFARLGVPTVAESAAEAPQSFLVCFGRPAHPGDAPLERKWVLPPPAARSAWEGAPVWADGRVYAAFAKFDGNRVTHAVTCYDDPPGPPVWTADLADSPPPGGTQVRHRHELLTLAGGNLVFCTQTGVVEAVDARTGKPAWAVRYPKVVRTPATTAHRDIAPPLAHGGRVFVAPTDSDHVLALDAQTGRILWQTGPFLTDHLLGVSRGRLVCAVAGPTRGIRGLSVTNGSYREPDGWAVHDDPELTSFGRGLVNDDLVLWSTRSPKGIFLLSPNNGLPVRPPIPGPQGNLAYADGVLLAATPTELRGFVPNGAHLPERKLVAERRPDDPVAARRLAFALADVGHWDEAGRVLERAAPTVDAPRTRAEWLADRAERVARVGRTDEARRLLEQAAAAGSPLPWRVRAAGRLLDFEPAGGATSAEQFLARLKLPVDMEAGWVYGPDGVPVRLSDLLARHFAAPTPPRGPPTLSPAKLPPIEFDVLSLTDLGPDIGVGRVTTFPSAGFVPLLPFAGENGLPGLGQDAGNNPLLLVTDGREVLAYRPGTEKPSWTARLPAGVEVTHAAVAGDSVIAAGPRGAVRLRRTGGQPAWSFVLPDTDPLPDHGPQPVPRSNGVPTPVPGLSAFVLAGPRLVARLGDHHLLALDLGTGSVAWVLDSKGRRRYAPVPLGDVPRFGGLYADERVVIAQLSTGLRWVVNAETGDDVRIAPSPLTEWAGPAVRVTAAEVIVPTDPSGVATLHAERNRPVGSFTAGRPASLTGRPPALKPVPGGVVVAVCRNHGTDLHRLTGARLDPAWPSPVFLPAAAVDLAAADVTDSTLYVPAEGKLYAVRLGEPSPTLRPLIDLAAEVAPAPASEWRVRTGRRAIFAYPAEPIPADSPGLVVGRLGRSFLRSSQPFRLPAAAVGVYDAWTGRTLPVLVLDPDTGRVCRRLDLPAGPTIGVHLGPGVNVVAAAGKAYWLQSP